MRIPDSPAAVSFQEKAEAFYGHCLPEKKMGRRLQSEASQKTCNAYGVSTVSRRTEGHGARIRLFSVDPSNLCMYNYFAIIISKRRHGSSNGMSAGVGAMPLLCGIWLKRMNHWGESEVLG